MVLKECSRCELSCVCLSGVFPVELWRCSNCLRYRVLREGSDFCLAERTVGYTMEPLCAAHLPVFKVEACPMCTSEKTMQTRLWKVFNGFD